MLVGAAEAKVKVLLGVTVPELTRVPEMLTGTFTVTVWPLWMVMVTPAAPDGVLVAETQKEPFHVCQGTGGIPVAGLIRAEVARCLRLTRRGARKDKEKREE